MKKKMLAALVSLFAFGTLSLSAQAVIKFEKTSHDFGQFAEKDAQTVVFKFTNAGNEPLVINQAFSSCGCTVPSYTKTEIQPGGAGELRVTYNGRGKVPGHFKKSVSVMSNASNKLVRLYIEGTMTSGKNPEK